ncbi:DUF302 domain-containing protein [Dehalogenimonas alkenigignens]|uniref:DUF302 domain-containing protein n=1 Tax=Dehalogenimonas alkenigignens TaxID=1217799 RepID=A0A0W0GHK0_9CHLR|nr:DUF302 domain-containing protein [Dehalogenimonas alkenigignens]KTB48031.1 hypothetical protein DEALK_08760 [Dehalogenimonas alkenigignens]PVV84287.1 DUF302 domain-containing protein [Dehalogenimonas alkenigignens]
MEYGYKRQASGKFDDIVLKVRAELKKEGFGVITEIDVKKTVKEKLGADFENYLILGACNPPFAHKALLAERDIGLFMPCNVIVYEDGGAVFVSAIRPTLAMSMTGNPALKPLADEVENRLKKAVDSI